MLCYLLYMNVNKNNIDNWERLIIKSKQYSLSNVEKRIISYYGVSNLFEYISLIKSNINDESKINLIIDNYNQRKKEKLENDKKIEEIEYNRIINNSIKISKNNNNIKIRLLINDEREKAIELYQKFKQTLDIDDYIDDFILKNRIFGIFEKEELAGIVIIEYNRNFTIGERIPTFYIQELFINDNYRRKGFADLIFKYLILICPIELNYITFMTHHSNIPMINISKKYNFNLYEKKSGDINNPLLFIRINSNNNEFKSVFL